MTIKIKEIIIGVMILVAMLLSVTNIAHGAPCFVNQGCTGLTSVSDQSLLVGSTTAKELNVLEKGQNGTFLGVLNGLLSWISGTTTAREAISSNATGLDYATTTGIFSLTSGYNIPLTASTTNWESFYTTPSTRITAGTGLSWAGNTLNNTATEADTLQSVTDRGATTTVVSQFTNGLWSGLLRAISSAGTLFESNNGSDVALFGAGGGQGALFYDGVTVTDSLIVDTDTLYANATLNNVGISTTTPSARFTIVNASTNASIFIQDTSGTDSTPFVLDANGNLGIGTETPTQLLTVNGASGLDGATPITSLLYSTSNGTWTDESIMAQLLFGSADTGGGAGNKAGIKAYIDDTSGSDIGMSFWTTTSGATSFSEKMRINHTGQVAIGTTITETPSTTHRFSVIGTGLQLYASDVLTDDTSKQFRIGMPHYDNGTNDRPFIGWYMSADNGSNNTNIGGGTSAGYASTNIRFVTASNSTTTTGSTRASIASDGKFLIGNATAMGALTIGEARSFSGMTSSLSGRILGTEAITITDTDQTGTIANRNAVAFRTPTFASTNSVTLTESASVYVASDPTAGTNTTITNPYALWVDTGRTRLDGALRLGYRASTGTTTMATTTDYRLNITSGSGTVTPPSATVGAGSTYMVINSGTGAITLDPVGSETINGASTYPLNVQYSRVKFFSNGSNWLIESE